MPFKIRVIHQCILLCGVIVFPLLQAFNPSYLKVAVLVFMLIFLLSSADQLNIKGSFKFIISFLKLFGNNVQRSQLNSFYEDQSEAQVPISVDNVEADRSQFSVLSLNSTGNKSSLNERSRKQIAFKNKMRFGDNTSLNIKEGATQLISFSTCDPSPLQVSNDILPEGSGLNFKPALSNTIPNSVKNLTQSQPFQYYLCFDVEATCEQGGGFDYKNEIIEFPILLIESKTFNVLFNEKSCSFLTDGPWDIRDFITKQCKISKIHRPTYFSLPWVDIRTMFAKFYHCRTRNIPSMLAHYGLKFEGHEHSGIDDAKNLAIIAKRLWEDGAVFRTNRKLQR
ncbi:11241_t:CDS:2 [Scutellospora calospora]|uniref:11241_t:CDS:1 n=1 Tax=Scutellospora calospora TaxID=85575 RepID=A0ACA9KX33_9GLOM|nr:11241_t:CDS:2 [Scutellospora calospora]